MRGHVSDVTVILLANQRSPQLLIVHPWITMIKTG